MNNERKCKRLSDFGKLRSNLEKERVSKIERKSIKMRGNTKNWEKIQKTERKFKNLRENIEKQEKTEKNERE